MDRPTPSDYQTKLEVYTFSIVSKFFAFDLNGTKLVLKPAPLHQESIDTLAGLFCPKLRKKLRYTQTNRAKPSDGQTNIGMKILLIIS